MPAWFRIFPSKAEAESVLPPNAPQKLILNGKPLCIVRINKEIFAMDDTCPHNKASLSGGWVNTFNEIICPLHEYRYDLISGRESALRCDDLQTYRVRADDDGVFLFM